jgi:hypothetical protein
MPSGPRNARPQTHWYRTFFLWLPAILLMARPGGCGVVCVILFFLCPYVSWDPRCLCLLHWQEQGGQDCAFQFRVGFANYKAHNDLFWFRPLLGGNSPTSSGLILKMNRCYKGVSRELKKFMW